MNMHLKESIEFLSAMQSIADSHKKFTVTAKQVNAGSRERKLAVRQEKIHFIFTTSQHKWVLIN